MNHRLLIFILAALCMLGALSIDAYLPALPAIAKDFGVTAAAAQQTLTIYLFGFAFMMLFYGTLSDSFGRRPVILAALVCYLASSIGAVEARSLGTLLVCRLLQGLSAGAGQTVGPAIVTDLLKGAEAQRALSFMWTIFGVAPAIAPILGGWLQAEFGWHSIFIFIALFTLILLGICCWLLPESLPRDERHPFHFKVIVAHYWEVGRHGRFLLRSFGYALALSAILIYVASAPAFVFNILHLTVKDFGWLFLPLIGGMTLGSFLSGRLSRQIKPRTLIRAGYAIMLAATVGNLIYTSLCTAAIPWAVIPVGVYGLGMALALPAMLLAILELFPRIRGMASSLQGFISMGAFAIGSGVICPLIFDSAFHLAAGVAAGLALSLLCWWLGRTPDR